MGSVKWDQRELDREVDREMVKMLTRIGLRGEGIAKELISGELRAVDKGILRSRLTYAVKPRQLLVQIGIGITNKFAQPIFYAIHVFLGTSKMPARPVLRTMLMRLRAELKGK